MMKQWKRMAGVVLAGAMFAGPVWGDEPKAPPAVAKPTDQVKPAEPAKPVKPAAPEAPAVKESATEPKPKAGNWVQRHEKYLAEVKEKAGAVDMLFVGDSITDGWHGQKKIWEEAWGKYKPFNIGIGGDRTQHVMWRLQNGEVAGIKPKLAMLMIGTNNLSANKDEEIVAGITGCVREIQKQLPGTKVLLLAVFPRSVKATDAARGRIKAINAEIAKLDDGGKTVKFLDIGEKFLDAEGNLPKEIMPDALHLSPKGYQIWADATKSAVEEMVK